MNGIMERHTLADLILKYPVHRAQENVLTFLDAAGNEKTTFTFDELRHQCVQVAVNISLQVHAKAVVLVALEDQADFVKAFFGCIMAGCIPAPLPAFAGNGNKKGIERVLQIIKGGEIKFVLVTEEQAFWLSKELKRAGLNEVRMLTIESLTQLNAACRALPVLAPDDMAYLQYTSGSTSAPKGVILTQESVLNNLAKMYRVFHREDLVRVVGWLPFHHDMGLVGHLFTVLYESGQGIFMPPEAFLASPEIWLQAISRYKGNSAASPAFAFEHCIRKAPADTTLDLSGWKNVYVGSETVSLNVLDGFYEKFRNAGFHRNAFRPVYGLAEATLLVAGGDKGLNELHPDLNIKTQGNQQRILMPYHLDTTYDEVTIHDPANGTMLADGEQGEILVKSDYNSIGYFRNTDELSAGEQRVIKTGDLGFKQNGYLYVTGRLKDVIIVRGANYVAEDLEIAIRYNNDLLQSNDATACVAHVTTAQEKFYVFQEVHRHSSKAMLDDVVASIRAGLAAAYNILPDVIVLIPRGCMPRTTSYKIKRKTCLDQYLAGELSTLFTSEESVKEPGKEEDDPVVIVGMACRFPGGADTPQRFWELLNNGVDAITEVPADRWDHSLFYDPEPAVPGKTNTKWAGFIDHIDYFDASLFGISDYEAPEIDPQQRLLLETSWRLLEHAGWKKDKLAGSDTGVFVGVSGNDYLYMKIKLTKGMESFNAYSGLGNANSIAANRLSYFYDLKGPSMAVDTACSSSLTAFHLGVKAIINGDCQQAIVGGVNAILSPGATITLSQFGMMASDGRCKTFDASADGYVRAEGCGLVMLKKRSAALRDGDRILAVVAASVIGQDGQSSGITFPNGMAQNRLIKHALKEGNLRGSDINYIEAHGTGTASGDPAELEQLIKIYGDAAKGGICYVGSVKANIGHLESCAGIASVIKTVLMLEQKQVPPQIHLNKLNPRIALEGTRLKINKSSQPWQTTHSRRAAISSFGFGGALAHVILEEPVPVPVTPKQPVHQQMLFPISGVTPGGLKAQVRHWTQWLGTNPEMSLMDICFTQSTGRTDLKYNHTFLTQSAGDLTQQLLSFGGLPENIPPSKDSQQKIAFLFTGQGEQYLYMGKELYERYPVFRAAFDRCAIAFDSEQLPSLKKIAFEIVAAHEWNEELQCALFAIQYALGLFWQECGIIPHVLLGHSLGEYAAACLAGCFEPETGIQLVKKRAALINSINGERGIMASIFAGVEEVSAELDFSKAQIAAINSPQKTVISGTVPEVERVVNFFKQKNIQTYFLKTQQAFHSHLMAPAESDFSTFLAGISFKEPSKKWVSSATGEEVIGAPGTQHWINHLRNTVLFDKAIGSLKDDEITVFIEIGPGASLLAATRECLPESKAMLLRSLNVKKGDRTESYHFLDAAGKLYQKGYTIHWNAIQEGNFYPHLIPGQKLMQRAYRAEGLEPYRIAQFAGPQNGTISQPVILAPVSQHTIEPAHYQLEWISKEGIPAVSFEQELSKPVNWIIVGNTAELAASLVTQIRAYQKSVFWLAFDAAESQAQAIPDVTIPWGTTTKDYFRMLDKIINQQTKENSKEWKVVFLASSNNHLSGSMDPQLAAEQNLGILIPLLQAMAQQALIAPLWVITEQSQQVGQEQINPHSSTVWGFAKTLFLEHPEWRGGMIDVDASTETQQRASDILAKVLLPQKERCIAIRNRRQFIEVIQPSKPVSAPVALRSDGAYIITGGLGGLGLKTAEWIVSKGGRHLILITRRKLLPEKEWGTITREHTDYAVVKQLISLKQKGVIPEVVSLDVCDIPALEQLFGQLESRAVPVRGVVHAAGVNWFSKIRDLNTDRFLSTLKIKVAASWALHELTRNHDLDCFILFSSVSALWGSVDLSHYTAANHFMDALSLYRAQAGLKTLSINWGPWGEVGMSSYDKETEVLHKLGFELMAPEAALSAMETALSTNVPLTLIGDIEWQKFRTFIDFSLQPSLFSMVSEKDALLKEPVNDGMLSQLLNSTPEEARASIESTVRLVLRRVMLLESIDKVEVEQRFNFLGMDSLMAISFVAELELCFSCKLPNTLAYNYPHIKAVTEYLFELLYVPGEQLAEPLATAPVTSAHNDVENASSQWLKVLKEGDTAQATRLICFPYAGSGASIYNAWIHDFGGDVELIAVQPPGREERADTAAFTAMPQLIEALKPYLMDMDAECYFFGHSLGALMAYECYAALKRANGMIPVKLILSGCNAPLSSGSGSVHQLAGDAFVEEILKNHKEDERDSRRAAMMGAEALLRADITLLESYQPSKENIDVPLIVVTGLQDTIATPDRVKAWVQLANKDFSIFYLDGGHDLVRQQKTGLINIIKQAMKGEDMHLENTLLVHSENMY